MQEEIFPRVYTSFSESIKRTPNSNEPFVKFSLALDRSERVITIKHRGDDLIWVILEVLGAAGGL